MDDIFEAIVVCGIAVFAILAQLVFWLSLAFGVFWIAQHFGVL